MLASRVVTGFLALFLLFPAAARGGDAVTFVSTDTPPFWSPSMPEGGWAGGMLKLLSETAGVRYRIEYLPVKRFRASRAPFIVGDPGILEHFEHRAIFPISIFRAAFFFHTPRQEPVQFLSLAQMRGHTLGVLRGTMEDKGDFIAKGIRVEESDSIESLLKKLERGRIDFAIMAHATGLHTVHTLFPRRAREFSSVLIPGTERPIAVIVDRGHPAGREVARRYQRTLREVLRSPRYRTLLEQAYGTDAVPLHFHAELNRFVEFFSDTWEE